MVLVDHCAPTARSLSDAGDPFVPTPHRVVSRTRETDDTVTLALEPVAGAPMDFEPGQFNMLYAFGVGEAPISISGAPDAGPLLHTVRAVGAVTRALCGTGRGDVVGVRGPYGAGWGVAEAAGRDIVVIAGGIGIAPLRGAILGVLRERQRYGRVAVVVGARSPDLLLYARDLRAWRGRFDVEVEVSVDFAPSGWQGKVGVVTQLIPRIDFDPELTTAFVCGPEIMMRLAAAGLVEAGVAPANIRLSVERNMKCGVGLCGHCQLGPLLLCRDGPVVTYDRVGPLLEVREL